MEVALIGNRLLRSYSGQILALSIKGVCAVRKHETAQRNGSGFAEISEIQGLALAEQRRRPTFKIGLSSLPLSCFGPVYVSCLGGLKTYFSARKGSADAEEIPSQGRITKINHCNSIFLFKGAKSFRVD